MATKNLKDYYDETFMRQLSEDFKMIDATYDDATFLNEVIGEGWEAKTLRERMNTIAHAYHDSTKLEFVESINCLHKLPFRIDGFYYLFLNDYIAHYGCSDMFWDCSMKAMESFTQKNSAEFAIRTFLEYDFNRTMKQIKKWSKSKNEHLRRLSSEGIRTRLPWGKQVPQLFKSTDKIVKILEQLKSDPSTYVQKSVANNLNDLSKDYPELIVEIIKEWKLDDPTTKWILQHGTRTLRKQGYEEVLKLMGYGSTDVPIDIKKYKFALSDKKAILNHDTTTVTYEIKVSTKQEVKIKIGLAIDFMKANGKQSRKIFHLKDQTINGSTTIAGNKKYEWKDLSTRKHYAGKHTFTLLINGEEIQKNQMDLKKL